MRRVVLSFAGLIVAALVLTLVPMAPAGAAIGPPGLVAPAAAANVAANPTFEWTAGTDAVRYVLQISTSSTMTPIVASVSTTNLTATPVTDLPPGALHWRVVAYDQASGGTAANSVVRTFTKAAFASPVLTGPATGAALTHPTMPTFTWAPVADADRYEVLVMNAAMTTVYVNTGTDLTALTPTASLPLGATLVWTVRARATNGTWSAYSSGRTFSIAWSTAPTGLAPGVLQSSYPATPAPNIEQVELSWNPVSGAAAYDVELDGTVTRVLGSRYAPPQAPSLTTHVWRVRAVSSDGTPSSYAPAMIFNRSWPGSTPNTGFDTLSLVSPTDGDLAVREPTFTWSPLRGASRYQLTFASDAGFSNVVGTETTTKTTFTPGPGTFDPAPGAVYYWRVRGIDDPVGTLSPPSATRRFSYVPEALTQTAPANGSSTFAPVLEWSRSSSPSIGRYTVTITDATGALVRSVDTYNSAYAPSGLSTAATKNPHTWKVQTLDRSGRRGPLPPTGRTFTVAAPTPGQLQPTPGPTSPAGASATRVPPLTWNPVTTNGTYTVRYRTAGSPFWTDLASGLTIPALAPTDDGSVFPGTYEWQVEARSSTGALLGTGAIGTFSVISLASSVPVSPAHCPVSDPCPYLNDQPTLDWDPVPGATHYRVTIARDQYFTNEVSTTETAYSRYTPTASGTGGTYYWYARPCSGVTCGPEAGSFAGAAPVRAYKQSFVKIPRLTPAQGSTQTGSQVTFTWTGFLQANQAVPVAERVTAEARGYHVEVYADANRTTQIERSPLLDSTTYTSTTTTYPDGTLYWRVVAVDGTGNELAPNASPLGSFTKTTTAPVPSTPAAAASVLATPTLAWTATPFAASYEVEVYRDLAQPISFERRVFAASVPTPAATPVEALPAGEYGWRVRAVDATGRTGAWSATTSATVRRFTIAGPATTLSAPANATVKDLNRLRFVWAAVPAATRSRIEISSTNTFSGIVVSADTVMNEWSPTAALPSGTYWWRVRTLDANSNPIATSAAWSFSG